MTRLLVASALAVSLVAPHALADDSKEVAGRPALSTESTDKLIEQRTKWGTEPSQSKAGK